PRPRFAAIALRRLPHHRAHTHDLPPRPAVEAWHGVVSRAGMLAALEPPDLRVRLPEEADCPLAFPAPGERRLAAERLVLACGHVRVCVSDRRERGPSPASLARFWSPSGLA